MYIVTVMLCMGSAQLLGSYVLSLLHVEQLMVVLVGVACSHTCSSSVRVVGLGSSSASGLAWLDSRLGLGS
jgi:hypothetical protein